MPLFPTMHFKQSVTLCCGLSHTFYWTRWMSCGRFVECTSFLLQFQHHPCLPPHHDEACKSSASANADFRNIARGDSSGFSIKDFLQDPYTTLQNLRVWKLKFHKFLMCVSQALNLYDNTARKGWKYAAGSQWYADRDSKLCFSVKIKVLVRKESNIQYPVVGKCSEK